MNYDTANYEQTESAVIRMTVQANTGMNMINKRPERPEDQQVDHHTLTNVTFHSTSSSSRLGELTIRCEQEK